MRPLSLVRWLLAACALGMPATTGCWPIDTHVSCQDRGYCPELEPDGAAAGASGTGAGGAGSGGASGAAAAGTGGAPSGGTGGTAPCNGECTPPMVCSTATNTCVQCLAKTDCSTPTPACDTATHTCVECTGNGDCSGTQSLCDTTSHACVECLANTDCTDAAASRCDAGTCKPCTENADCSQITGKTVCDTGSGQCFQCTGTDYATCGTDSATSTPLVCDSLQHTCTTNKEHGSGLCQPCVSDANCPLGQMCVLETFGTPTQDVGYFCFWKQGGGNGAPTDCFATGRPYAGTRTNAMSIDGTTADICTLRVSTCVANNEFSSKTCTSTADNTSCGFDPPNDAKCGQVSVSSFACTMTCVSDVDCPAFTCNIGVNPHVCNLQ